MTFTKPLLNFILIWQWHCLLSEFRGCSFSFFLSFKCAAARSPCQSSIKCHIAVKTLSCTELHLLLEILGSQSFAQRVKMYVCIQKLHLLGLLFPFFFFIYYYYLPLYPSVLWQQSLKSAYREKESNLPQQIIKKESSTIRARVHLKRCNIFSPHVKRSDFKASGLSTVCIVIPCPVLCSPIVSCRISQQQE